MEDELTREEIKAIDALDTAINLVLKCNDALPETAMGDEFRLPLDITERLIEIRNEWVWLEKYHAQNRLTAA
jgi:hypothetical protein